MNEDSADKSAPQQERRGPGASNAHALLTQEVPASASRATPKLRELLTGTLLVEVSGTGKKYLYDWSQPQVAVVESAPSTPADCVISLNESNLMQVARGDLNPQIAMLSDKIRISGRASTALYFFNLIAPRLG